MARLFRVFVFTVVLLISLICCGILVHYVVGFFCGVSCLFALCCLCSLACIVLYLFALAWCHLRCVCLHRCVVLLMALICCVGPDYSGVARCVCSGVLGCLFFILQCMSVLSLFLSQGVSYRYQLHPLRKRQREREVGMEQNEWEGIGQRMHRRENEWEREGRRQTDREKLEERDSVCECNSLLLSDSGERERERTKERKGREIMETKGCIVTELRERESRRGRVACTEHKRLKWRTEGEKQKRTV